MAGECPCCGAPFEGRRGVRVVDEAVYLDGKRAPFTKKEVQYAEAILRGNGAPVDRERIMGWVYQLDPNGGPACGKNVDVHICHMRKKLRAFGWAIKTQHGCGFYFERVES